MKSKGTSRSRGELEESKKLIRSHLTYKARVTLDETLLQSVQNNTLD